MITVGISNHGLAIATTTTIPVRDRPICKQSISAVGNSSSMAPISFENLLSTRPDVFVLKKRIVARLMLRNIRS